MKTFFWSLVCTCSPHRSAGVLRWQRTMLSAIAVLCRYVQRGESVPVSALFLRA
jgi:hypothetical protein